MSLVESYQAARKARLIRLGAPSPYQAPVVTNKAVVQPQKYNAGWENMWFHDLIQGTKEPREEVPVREIKDAVCRHYCISALDLTSDRRDRAAVLPRQMAMYLARLLTPLSYAEIGRLFRGRDHSTALHAKERIEKLLVRKPSVAEDFKALRRVLA